MRKYTLRHNIVKAGATGDKETGTGAGDAIKAAEKSEKGLDHGPEEREEDSRVIDSERGSIQTVHVCHD
jgi:hypothetical protein